MDGGQERPLDWRLVAAIALIMAAPILVTPIPLLIDFPSHIARFHVERDLSVSSALRLNFTYDWRFIPNLGVDLIVAVLGRLVGVEPAARIAAALIPALGAIGMLLTGHALHRRLTVGTLLALPLNYAYPLIFGFVNSCLSVSLALVVFGLWLMLGERHTGARATLAIVAAPIVLTAHIIGYGSLGLMVAGAALAEQLARRRSPFAVVQGVAKATAPLAWPLLLLLLWRTGDGAPTGRWFDWNLILTWLSIVLRDRYMAVDLVSAGLLYAALALPIVARRRFGVATPASAAAALLWLAVVTLPGRAFGSEFASVRLIPVALALSLLAISERGRPPRPLLVAAAGFAALRLALNAATLLDSSRAAEREIAVLEQIPPGARVAAVDLVDCARGWLPPRLSHVSSYATIRRDAFVNGQFIATAGQSLGLTGNVDPALAGLLSTGTLTHCARFYPPTALNAALQALPWARIDYLWLIDVGETPVALPPAARLIRRNGGSRLYAIRRPR